MYEELLPAFTRFFDAMVISNSCPFTAAAYLDIMGDIAKALLGSRSKKF